MKNRVITKSLVALAALAAIGGGASLAMIASAQTPTTDTTSSTPAKAGWHMGMRGPRDRGVMGTVSAVDGNTVTITNKDGTSYTVDASSAKVTQITSVTVGDIKVGDTVGVQGSVSGNSVKAVHIMDGLLPPPQAPPAGN